MRSTEHGGSRGAKRWGEDVPLCPVVLVQRWSPGDRWLGGQRCTSPAVRATGCPCSRPTVVSSGVGNIALTLTDTLCLQSTAADPPYHFSFQEGAFKSKHSCYLVVDLGGKNGILEYCQWPYLDQQRQSQYYMRAVLKTMTFLCYVCDKIREIQGVTRI